MPALTKRLLGFAFAAADLMIEIDERRRVVLAIGAHSGKDGGLIGRRLDDLIAATDRGKLEPLFNGLRASERRGPEALSLLTPDGYTRGAELSVFALPDLKPHVSCAISFTGEARATSTETTLDPEAFHGAIRDLLERAASAGQELSLALVEIKGLIEARRNLSAEKLAALHAKIQTLVARCSWEGAATRLTEERFAIVQERPDDLGGLLQGIGALSQTEGVELEASGQTVALPPEQDPLKHLRAVRMMVDSFLGAGLPTDEDGLRRKFNALLDGPARPAGGPEPRAPVLMFAPNRPARARRAGERA